MMLEDYLNNDEKKLLENMKCGGLFKNKSYYGYNTSILKSGICKYYRREIFDKFEWCIMEMVLMGYKNKGIMTNLLNRLSILLMEEISVREINIVYNCILILHKFEKTENIIEKIYLLKRFCDIVQKAKKGRIVSYVKNWWMFHDDNNSNVNNVNIDKIKKYEKKGDNETLLKYGELMLDYIEKEKEKIVKMYLNMEEIKEKVGLRYRRKTGEYLCIEILENIYCDTSEKKIIFDFVLKNYNKKKTEKKAFGVWLCLLYLYNNYSKLYKYNDLYDFEKIDEKNIYHMMFKERKYIEINEDFVVRDYHVNKNFGLEKFRSVGAYVENEDIDILGIKGEMYREFYKNRKLKNEVIIENKNNKKLKKNKKVKKNVKLIIRNRINEIEKINDFNNIYEIIKILDDGVCSLKRPCILIKKKNSNKKYVLKEMSKTLNYGKDYLFMDKIKEFAGLRVCNMKRIQIKKKMVLINNEKKNFNKNCKIIDLDDNNYITYCLMDYFENIGDVGKNKNRIECEKDKYELLKIRLVNGLFRTSDNIIRNILINEKKDMLAIDENDIYGKRKNVFNKNDYCFKDEWYKKNIEKVIKEEIYKKISKKECINLLNKFEFNEKMIEEFENRYDNYIDIVKSEF